MITFQSASLHSLEIQRNGRLIGLLEWHPERDPQVVIFEPGYLTIGELRDCVRQIDELKYRVGV